MPFDNALLLAQDFVDEHKHYLNGIVAQTRHQEQLDLILSDSNVSRVHCEISIEMDRFKIMDKECANGTFINGVELQKNETKKFSIGDIIQICSYTLILKDEDPTSAD